MSGTRISGGSEPAVSRVSHTDIRPGKPDQAGKPDAGVKEQPALKPQDLNSPLKPGFVSGKNPSAVLSEPPVSALSGRERILSSVFKETAASLGFPRDTWLSEGKLNVAIITFARFFSVPLNPELIRTIRREILASGKSSSPDGAQEKAALEAEAQAAVIIRDKGVVLTPEALERYARFLVPPEGRQSSDGRRKDREECPDAEELRVLIEEQGENDALLNLMNSIPGKNGQHWMVFPFIINVKGIELEVFLRLLKEDFLFSAEGCRVIVDISGPKRQWRCFLQKAGKKFLADIRVYPECDSGTLKLLRKDAEHFLSEGGAFFGSFKGFDEVFVRNSENGFSFAEDLNAESFPSINEEI